ncbi:MAG: hypothetical protein ACPL7K_04015 [Armatimonadota bacterium]
MSPRRSMLRRRRSPMEQLLAILLISIWRMPRLIHPRWIYWRTLRTSSITSPMVWPRL